MSRLTESFAAIVGAENVLSVPENLESYTTATFEQTNAVLGVVKPSSREEVQSCVRLANSAGVSLYPVSRGRNAGYGSRAPTSDRCVILDLSRMNRILEYDEKLAYVVVEPGVSFIQLFQYLRKRDSSLYLSVTGGPGDGSIIGNIAERGLGSGFYADRHENCCALEVVLPDGDCLSTGYARYPGARAKNVHRAGVGPGLDGLFIQSNLGIITKLTLWLMPIPEAFHTFTFSLARGEQFERTIDALRSLLLHGLVRSTYLFLWNDYKQLSGRTRYPGAEAAGRTPLPDEIRLRIRSGNDWGGMGAIYAGSVERAWAERRQIEDGLRGVVDKLTFNERRREEIAALWKVLAGDERILSPGYQAPYSLIEGILLGIPTNANLATVYWRKSSLPTGEWNPEKDRCGTYALTLALPFNGADVAVAARIIEEEYTRGGYEPQMGLSRLKERSLDLISFLVYDRDIEGEDRRAHEVYKQTIASLAAEGIYPCRLSIKSMSALPDPADDSREFMRRIRAAIDPHRAIAPGRYEG